MSQSKREIKSLAVARSRDRQGLAVGMFKSDGVALDNPNTGQLVALTVTKLTDTELVGTTEPGKEKAFVRSKDK